MGPGVDDKDSFRKVQPERGRACGGGLGMASLLITHLLS